MIPAYQDKRRTQQHHGPVDLSPLLAAVPGRTLQLLQSMLAGFMRAVPAPRPGSRRGCAGASRSLRRAVRPASAGAPAAPASAKGLAPGASTRCRSSPDYARATLDFLDLVRLLTDVPDGADADEADRLPTERSRPRLLRRANGCCEGCSASAPFATPQGRPYLEPHHIRRLSDAGPDHPDFVIALCPNCHRRVHHGADGAEFNTELERTLAEMASG